MNHYSKDLPEYEQLADYYPPTLTRIHAGDGRLLAEFASERRVFVPMSAMPRLLVGAFLSAEDQRFHDHMGVDPMGIARAAIQNVLNLGSGQRLIGASTITQQVAKNFLLTNEVKLERKIREALLALRIERALSKERILELYLNEIFLGQRAYGVAAAAINYFDKSLDELTIGEMAYLASLPKAPNNYHPVRNAAAARERRNYVLGRMVIDGHITQDDAAQAMADPVIMLPRDPARSVTAPYFAEEVRRELERRYGEQVLYQGGLSVRSTMDPQYQEVAERTLRDGLIAYDRRHGWRGPLEHWDDTEDWRTRLAETNAPRGIGAWRMAVVLETASDKARVGLVDDGAGEIPFEEMKWARKWLENQRFGEEPTSVDQVLAVGDVVMVEALEVEEERPGEEPPANVEGAEPEAADPALFALRQIPDVEGAVVAMDPHNGRVLAMAGGWSFADSQFNRATQAQRQPGSAFKPFVYLSALENGFTPSDLVLDAPIVIDQGPGLPKWKPKNYSNVFYGPSTLRLGVEKSRNLMTVRLANKLGMDRISEIGRRFDIGDFPEVLSMALGAGETTLIQLTTAYGMLVNGGRRIVPAIIERIQDRHGRTIYRRDARSCDQCAGAVSDPLSPPPLRDQRQRVTDAASAFQITWVLKGVVDRGTGRRIASLKRPMGGKTGTTNGSFDTWFVGFSPDLVVGVFIGFDNPRTLGRRQTGSNVAAPVFKAFMGEIHGDGPPVPFRIPPGVRMVRIDADSGGLPAPSAERVLVEAFKPGTEPTEVRVVSEMAPSGDVELTGGVEAETFDSGLY
jgi:penicillin-binding protein 1A